MKKEVWRNILGSNNRYEVSNLGRIRNTRTLHIRKLVKYKEGYLQINLPLFNKGLHTYKVHRIVAQSFIPNPNNYKNINHKNEVKTDNRVENLEWCTTKYNNLYGTRLAHVASKLNKPVRQINKFGEVVRIFNSIKDVSSYGFDKGAVSHCCLKDKNYKTHKGYYWEFVK